MNDLTFSPETILDCLGEFFALSQETIARVNGAYPTAAGNLQDFVHAQIRLARRRWAKQIGFVGIPDVQGMAVGIGKHSHRFHSQFAAGPDDPDRNLPSVCN